MFKAYRISNGYILEDQGEMKHYPLKDWESLSHDLKALVDAEYAEEYEDDD